MEDSSSNSSSDSCSSNMSTRRDDRVVMCSLAKRRLALKSRGFDSLSLRHSHWESAAERSATCLESRGGVKSQGFDSSTLRHMSLCRSGNGLVCKTKFTGSIPVGDSNQNHTWVAANKTITWEHCGRCGIIRRTDGHNSKICKGAPRIGPRG